MLKLMHISNYFDTTQLIIVLGIVLLSNSLYFTSYGTNILLIPFFVYLVLVVLYKKKKLVVSRIMIFYTILYLLVTTSNMNAKYSSVLVLYLLIGISILIVNLIKFKNFIRYFNIIIFVISLFSSLTWIIISFNIKSFLPDFIGTNLVEFRNFIFFGIIENNIAAYQYRTNGLWWEPGAFQVFVNLAFIFGLIANQITNKIYFFYSLIIFFIQSTTGFLVFLLLSTIYLSKKILMSKYRYFYIILLVLLLIAVNIFVLPSILDKFTEGSSAFESFLSRYYDFTVSYNLFLDNWLFGYGYGSQIENSIPYGSKLLGDIVYDSPMRPTGSDGLTMFIAQNGIFSFLLIIPFLFPKYIEHMNVYEKVIISLSLFLLFNTENFIFILIFILLSFYGIVGSNFNQGSNR